MLKRNESLILVSILKIILILICDAVSKKTILHHCKGLQRHEGPS